MLEEDKCATFCAVKNKITKTNQFFENKKKEKKKKELAEIETRLKISV